MKFAKAQKGDGGAQSTKDKGFGAGSKKGITPSMSRGTPAKTKGNVAKFKAGKKSVGK